MRREDKRRQMQHQHGGGKPQTAPGQKQQQRDPNMGPPAREGEPVRHMGGEAGEGEQRFDGPKDKGRR